MEFFLRKLLVTTPYRCGDCDLRFFRRHIAHSAQTHSPKPMA